MFLRVVSVLISVWMAWASHADAGDLKAVDSVIWVDQERVAHRLELYDYRGNGSTAAARRYHHDGRIEFWVMPVPVEGVARWYRQYKEPGSGWERSIWEVAEFGTLAEAPRRGGLGLIVGSWGAGEVRVICYSHDGKRFVRSLRPNKDGYLGSIDEGFAVHTLDYEQEELVSIRSRDGLDFHRWVFVYDQGRLYAVEGMARRFVLTYDKLGRIEEIEELWRDDSGWRTTIRYYYSGEQGSSDLAMPLFDFGYLFDLKGRRRRGEAVGRYALVHALREGQCSGSAINR